MSGSPQYSPHGAFESVHFRASAVLSTGPSLERVPAAEGVEPWTDSSDKLTNLPTYLAGGTLFKLPHSSLQPGTAISVTALGADSRIYLSLEAELRKAKGRDGGLRTALGTSHCWQAEKGGPTWCGPDSEMVTFSCLLAQGAQLDVPPTTSAGFVAVLVAVPVFVGGFAVSIKSSSPGVTYDQMVLMQEDVLAWSNTDHRYCDVPSTLLGGLLVKGPHKGGPAGQVVDIRPNGHARVYIISERSASGGLHRSLPEAGWEKEARAPRWQEVSTMLLFSITCAAGHCLSLPPMQAADAIFSIVVVPCTGLPVAPVEASCCGPGAGDVPRLDLVPFGDGTPPWLDSVHHFSEIPTCMCGATLARGCFGGPGEGYVIAVRADAAAIVYVVLESEHEGDAGRSGGLAEALPADSWEALDEAPEWSELSSRLVVYKKHARARQLVTLPAIRSEGTVLAVVLKVNPDAFDAVVQTITGLQFTAVPMQENVVAWFDMQHKYTGVPPYLHDGLLFRPTHDATPEGTVLKIRASGACRVFVIVEATYNSTAPALGRSGGFSDSLPMLGWFVEAEAPHWDDKKSEMVMLSRTLPEGRELTLPATQGSIVFSLVVVGCEHKSHAAEGDAVRELMQAFRTCDVNGKGTIHHSDFEGMEGAGTEIPEEVRGALLEQADRSSLGMIPYEEVLLRVVLSGSVDAADGLPSESVHSA